MIDDFMIRALLGGIAVAIASGPLGSFIIWKRMAFFGDAVSHSSILGFVLGVALGVNTSLSVAAFAICFSLVITLITKVSKFSGDTVLGLTAHGMLALGIVLQAILVPNSFNMMNLLFGDILAISYGDLIFMYCAVALALMVIKSIWQPLLLATINEDLARVERGSVDKISFLYTVVVALIVALSVKIVGVLMVSAALIVPAAAARMFAKTPERMAVLASFIGVIAVFVGLFVSMNYDTLAGPSVVIAMFAALALASVFPHKHR